MKDFRLFFHKLFRLHKYNMTDIQTKILSTDNRICVVEYINTCSKCGHKHIFVKHIVDPSYLADLKRQGNNKLVEELSRVWW